jgi:putative flavoprotein involved in K+ transport
MKRTGVVVIGAGQAGLAMSQCLARAGVDHVVLERRRVAEKWRSERWDSLRLLTPNWLSRLPGWRYRGSDPHGFMTMPEVVRFLEDYARSSAAPVHPNTRVESVTHSDGTYWVGTESGDWTARSVVVATGHCEVPLVPAIAAKLSADIRQVTPSEYKRPEDLPDGGVLVVGAGAAGVQIAEELRHSGRDVVLSVGHHTRLPRRYRDRDIMSWLDRVGVLDETIDAVQNLEAARSQPSLQLVGRSDARSVDLRCLSAQGVRLAGRAIDADGTAMHLAASRRLAA